MIPRSRLYTILAAILFITLLLPDQRAEVKVNISAKRVRPSKFVSNEREFDSLPVVSRSYLAPPDSVLRLRIRPGIGELFRRNTGRSTLIEVALRNTGPDTLVLVLPGGGSFEKRRTPILRWEIRDSGGRSASLRPFFSCGNINPLGADEVFELAPGKNRKFTVYLPLDLYALEGGPYRIRLTYENRPGMRWAGIPLGPHDPAAMRWLRGSTPCKLSSNVLRVRIE